MKVRFYIHIYYKIELDFGDFRTIVSCLVPTAAECCLWLVTTLTTFCSELVWLIRLQTMEVDVQVFPTIEIVVRTENWHEIENRIEIVGKK